MRALGSNSSPASRQITAIAEATHKAAIVNSPAVKNETRIWLKPFPALAAERLHRAEARFVVHLIAALHPVTKIDVLQLTQARRAHVIEDHICAEAARVFAGVEETVNHRQPVAQKIAKRTSDECARF